EADGDGERLVARRGLEGILLAPVCLLVGRRKLGAPVLGRPGDRAVAGVALVLLPAHGAPQQVPLLLEGEVVEHADVVAPLAPHRRPLGWSGREPVGEPTPAGVAVVV